MRFVIFFIAVVMSGCIYMHVNHEPVYSVPRQSRPENQLKLGMTTTEVRELWGDPIKIIKGNGKQFDERWIYQPHWKIQRRLDFKHEVLIGGIKEQ
ncbi:MAG: hypothetical protein HGA80_06455 [Candidatus Omnitrophica bacterium]|nr:hypothetical protein [Candidatus Omnitrophota bacterium]